MTVFIALYRGINVGGTGSVKMESLRAMHESLGHRDVKSYIQSGNVVFSADGAARSITSGIANQFAKQFGFKAAVVVIDAKRLRRVIKENPYGKQAAENPKSVHVGFCEGEPSATGLKALLAKTGGPEEFAIRSDVVYLHAPDGVGRSKFAAGMEKASGVPMTLRNWRTVEALVAMLDTAE